MNPTKEMNRVRRQFYNPYFILLLPVFFVLHGFTQYYPLVLAEQVLVLLVTYIPAIVILSVIFYLIIRSWRTAFILGFFTSVFYLFFGTIHDWFKTWLDNTFFVKYSFILPFGFIVFILIIFFLRKKKPVFLKLSLYLNVLLLLLIVMETVLLGYKIGKEKKEIENRQASNQLDCKNCEKPDIYLILADEYAGKKQLQDVFRFDNSVFENQLKERGFYVVDSSISNYSQTTYSMASMFEMNYLKELKPNATFDNHRLALRTINESKFVNMLIANGYELKNYSIFQVKGELPYETTNYFKTGLDLVTGQTLLSRINRDIRFHLATKFKFKSDVNWIIDEELRTNQGLYRRTMDEARRKNEKPRFVYTHLLMPHHPFYFDRNGKRSPGNLLEDSARFNQEKYIEYLQYCNKKFIQLIDEILLNSERPSVIMLMSDYGFRGMNTDRKYQFMTLNAIYLQSGQYEDFYKGISNVNQLRVLLNTIFDQKLPLRKDHPVYIK